LAYLAQFLDGECHVAFTMMDNSASSPEMYAAEEDTEPLNERWQRMRMQQLGMATKTQRCLTPPKDCVPPDSPRVWMRDDDLTCQICQRSDNEDCMLLCDGCDQGFHTTCLTPALLKIPQGEWHCHECVKRKAWEKRATCAAEDNETPRQVANRLNIDLALLVSFNKRRYKGFTSNAKLQEGTLLEVPEEIKAGWSVAVGARPREQQPEVEQSQHEYEKAQKVQKRLERETKKRERARQEIDDLKNQLEKEKRRRIEAEDKLRTQKRIQSADLAAAANGEGASAGSIRKECIICFEREANQVLFPCGHSFTCAVCTNRLQSCPTCRRKVVRTCQLYL